MYGIKRQQRNIIYYSLKTNILNCSDLNDKTNIYQFIGRNREKNYLSIYLPHPSYLSSPFEWV